MTKHRCSGTACGQCGSHPCSRPATVQCDGQWWCWQHDPERAEADKKKRRAVRLAKMDRLYARRARNANLAELVTPELVTLLGRLAYEANMQYEKAGDAGNTRTRWAIQLHADDKAARELAARIREVLEAEYE